MKNEKQDYIKEFEEVIDEIFGVYLDSNRGFIENSIRIDNIQNDFILNHKFTKEYLDERLFTYGDEHPDNPNKKILHNTTQKEFRYRNKKDGLNSTVLANLCLVQVYQYWEDWYREKIAIHLGLDKNDLKSDIFGDIRILRISIVHHRGIALKEINKCKIIRYFNFEEQIKFTQNQMNELFGFIYLEIEKFKGTC